MDIAVNLVETYLRLNGYLTLSEMEVQAQTAGEDVYRTLTDVDIVGLRFPGDMFAADAHDPDSAKLLLIEDDVLRLEPEVTDVIIGEVKQGDAVFNKALTKHEVLHSVLRRIEWIYEDGIHPTIAQLEEDGLAGATGRGGGTIRTRLVAFGRSDVDSVNTIPIGHIAEKIVEHLERFSDVLAPAQFKEPAPALLRLLMKAGFSIAR